MSLYELKEKGNEMVLFLIETTNNTKMFLDYSKSQLEPLFNTRYVSNEEANSIKLIKTIKPAKFKKEGDFWVLEEKGEIEYVK